MHLRIVSFSHQAVTVQSLHPDFPPTPVHAEMFSLPASRICGRAGHLVELIDLKSASSPRCKRFLASLCFLVLEASRLATVYTVVVPCVPALAATRLLIVAAPFVRPVSRLLDILLPSAPSSTSSGVGLRGFTKCRLAAQMSHRLSWYGAAYFRALVSIPL